MLFHKIEALAKFEGCANGLAVVFSNAHEAVDAIVAFGILCAARTHDRRVHGSRRGKDLDAVDVELAARIRSAVGIDAQNEIAGNGGERRSQLGGILDIAGGELRSGELKARGVNTRALAEEMNVQRALRKSGARSAVRTNSVIRVRYDPLGAQRILHGILRH